MKTRKSVKSRKTAQAGKSTRSRKARKATPAGPVVALSNEQVTRVLKLLKGANSVELKFVVPATGHRATIAGIGLDPVEAQPRHAFFFDTPGLDLNKAGLIVRARRIADSFDMARASQRGEFAAPRHTLR